MRILPEKKHTTMLYLGAVLGLLFAGTPYLIVRVMIGYTPSPKELLLLSSLVSLLCVALPSLIWSMHDPVAQHALKLHKAPSAPQHVLLFLMAFCLVILVEPLTQAWMHILARSGYSFSLYDGLPTADSLSMLFFLLVFAAILPAICEELLFRGLLMESLLSMGDGTAVFLSGLLFALMHGSVEGLPVHLLMGFVLGFAVLKTGSLRSGILLHFLYNALLLLEEYMANVHPATMLLLQKANTWPLMLSALFCLITCLLGLRRTAQPTEEVYFRRESGAVWLPLFAGLFLCLGVYAFQLYQGFLPLWRGDF